MSNEFVARTGIISKTNMSVTGSVTATAPIGFVGTSSWAINSVSSSLAAQSISSSFLNGPHTGSTFGTASWSSNSISTSLSAQSISSSYTQTASFAISASWAPTSGGGTLLITASTYQITSSFSVSASWAPSSGGTTIVTGSTYQITSSWANNSLTTITSSWASQSFSSTSSSFASSSLTASSLTGLTLDNIAVLINVTQSNVIVVQRSTGSYITSFFDYAVTSGSNNIRAGTVFGAWINNTASYSEYTTVDLGDTSQVTMSLFVTASNLQLLANIFTTPSWSVRTLGRYI